MAKFEVGAGFAAQFNTSGLGPSGRATVANAYLIKVEYSGGYELYLGNFQYPNNHDVTGTLLQYRAVIGGQVAYAMTGLHVDAHQLYTALLGGNFSSVFRILFNDDDTLIGNSLDDRMKGYDGDDVLLGRGGDDNLSGLAGDDTLDGGLGRDILIGGPGNDTFLFKAAPGDANVDLILGFSPADDTIALGHASFPGLGGGALNPGFFHQGAHAHDGNDRIIYDEVAGELIFDFDGSGAGAETVFAKIGKHLPVTSGDFFVV